MSRKIATNAHQREAIEQAAVLRFDETGWEAHYHPLEHRWMILDVLERDGEPRSYWAVDTDDGLAFEELKGKDWEGVVRASDQDLVVVETMPDFLRASHRAARNWGRYPANGAERAIVTRAEAQQIVADDPDKYAHLVRVKEVNGYTLRRVP